MMMLQALVYKANQVNLKRSFFLMLVIMVCLIGFLNCVIIFEHVICFSLSTSGRAPSLQEYIKSNILYFFEWFLLRGPDNCMLIHILDVPHYSSKSCKNSTQKCYIQCRPTRIQKRSIYPLREKLFSIAHKEEQIFPNGIESSD